MKVELNAQMQISVQKQNITAYVFIPLNSIYSEKRSYCLCLLLSHITDVLVIMGVVILRDYWSSF